MSNFELIGNLHAAIQVTVDPGLRRLYSVAIKIFLRAETLHGRGLAWRARRYEFLALRVLRSGLSR